MPYSFLRFMWFGMAHIIVGFVAENAAGAYNKKNLVRLFMKEPKILPFYMTYPLPIAYRDETDAARDLAYFRQLYPSGARLLQREVDQAISIMDYEGSMIYDEYPDKVMLIRLADQILDNTRKKKDKPKELEQLLSCDFIEEYVMMVLLSELLRRRNTKDGGYLMF
jgi:hypothetical protein